MLGFCIEASHERGLGHLFKTLNFIDYLKTFGEKHVVMINNNPQAANILDQHFVEYVTVNLTDFHTDWETEMIRMHGITTWINDRLDTDFKHAANIKKNGINLITFDDRGTGAALADLHFAPLIFSGQNTLRGTKLLTGSRYLVLNPEINAFKRRRDHTNSILVTLGGSDTFGVTIKIVKMLKALNQGATILIGPSFQHYSELEQVMDSNFRLIQGVPSLIQEFYHHDLAISGGGVTPFEANATGLPCIVVANELHEIEIGKHLAEAGSSVYAGYYRDINIDFIRTSLHMNICEMSLAGMRSFGTDGAANIMKEIREL